LLPVFSSSYIDSDALNLSTWWEARHFQGYYRRSQRRSTHQPSSSSRPAVSGPARHRSFSPQPGRQQRHRRRHHQGSRGRSRSRGRSCSSSCRRPSPSHSDDSIIGRAPSPLPRAPSPRRWAASRHFRKRLRNPTQKQRRVARRIREEQAARSAAQLERTPPTIRPVLPVGRIIPAQKARPVPKRPTTPPRPTAQPTVLLAAAPKGRAASVRPPAVHCPPGERPLLDGKIDLYAFGARGPEPESLRQ
jgi:hypothetical protein